MMSLAGALPLPLALGRTEPATPRAPPAAPAPGAAPAAAPIGPLIGPHLGNLHDILAATATQRRPRLSFLDPEWKSLEAWKRTARPFFRQQLCYDPKPLPLSAKPIKREERDGYSIETVRISATATYDIPARVLLPAKRKGRAPGIVALHCHAGTYVWGHEKILESPQDPEGLLAVRERLYRGRPFAAELARKGYVVIVIDAFYFGERRIQVETLDPESAPPALGALLRDVAAQSVGTAKWYSAVNRACGQYETLTAKTIFSAGATWPGIMVWDDMRTVDYLCSRPEVDPNRIGALGLSIGGLRTAHLVAADARIKAACVAGWMTEFPHQLRNNIASHTWMAYIPGLYPAMGLPDAAALTAPGALMVVQCNKDKHFPMAGMKAAVEKLERVYSKAKIPDKFLGKFYDEPHCFAPHMQADAFEWLDRWLT